MSSGRKRGRPKRKAQRRAKWQAEQRFSKRTKRQDPKRERRDVIGIIEAGADALRRGFRFDVGVHADEYEYGAFFERSIVDGAPGSPYAARKEA